MVQRSHSHLPHPFLSQSVLIPHSSHRSAMYSPPYASSQYWQYSPVPGSTLPQILHSISHPSNPRAADHNNQPAHPNGHPHKSSFHGHPSHVWARPQSRSRSPSVRPSESFFCPPGTFTFSSFLRSHSARLRRLLRFFTSIFRRLL